MKSMGNKEKNESCRDSLPHNLETSLKLCLVGIIGFFYFACTPTRFNEVTVESRSTASVAEPAALPKNCTYKNASVSHNAEADFFLSSSVAYNQSCSMVKRKCVNGTFDGNTAANFETCAPNAARACRFGNETVDHNKGLNLAQSDSVPYPQICEFKEAKCIDGRFSIDTQVYKYKNCSTDLLQSKNLTIQASFKSDPFKLLIIVDNSYTMSQTQERLSQNIDSLLRPLAGKNVQVRIASTSSDQNLNYVEYFTFKRQDGTTFKRFDNKGLYGLPEFSDPNIASIDLLRTYTENDIAYTLSLSDLDSAATTDTKIEQIKAQILAFGISGSDEESGLCSIYRYLNAHKFSTDSFFKPGDKSAVVVLSDEDDSSFVRSNNCTKSYSVAALWRTLQPNLYRQYYGKVHAIKVKFSFEAVYSAVSRDTILISPARTESRTDGLAYISSDFATNEEIQSGVCAQKAQNSLRLRGDNNSDWGNSWNFVNFSKSVVASCERIVTPEAQALFAVHYPASLTDVDSCSSGKVQTQFGVKNLSEADFESFPGYNLSPLPRSNVFGAVRWRFHSACARQNHGTADQTVERYIDKGSEPNTWNYYLSDVPTQSRQQIILDAAKEVFGQNFYMSFIVNPMDSSCQLKEGQSAGKAYHQFASLSEKMATYPICSASYTPALDSVRNFIQTVTVSKYPLGLPSAARIISVSKNDIPLNANDWEYVGGEIGLKSEVKAGDQVKVNWVPR